MAPAARPAHREPIAVSVPAPSAGPLISTLVALAWLTLAGCDRGPRVMLPNTLPTLTLTSGPVDTLSSPQNWLVDIAWTANDPDGAIDHFEYAIDPPTLRQAFALNAETTWVSTRETHVTARFRATVPDSVGPGATASDFHVFVLRAIDDRGGISPRLIRAFYAYTVAPDMKFTRPVPNPLLPASVPLPFRLNWEGSDPDGEGDKHPTAYRYRVLDLSDPGNRTFLLNPDSLRRLAHETGWEGWRTVSGDTTSLVMTNAEIPTADRSLLAMVAVDAAGASTPYITYDENLLVIEPSLGTNGPRIHIISPYVNFLYASGGYVDDPLREIPIEVPSGIWLDFGWDAIAAPGRVAESSRWRLDGDVLDEAGWSARGPAAQQARIPPQSAGVHRLYIEVTDDFGEKSLGVVKFTVVTAEFTDELLVVDDTRREVDKFNGPDRTLGNYFQPWPSAAELDTFLYARGGWPWRGAKNPAGALSTPGLFAGFVYDTLGTRLGLEKPELAVSLAKLGRYRHVLWLSDDRGASYRESDDQTIFPVTALRAMSVPGRFNALAAYVAAGGDLWLAGGGAAFASLAGYDRGANNTGGLTVFSSELDELGPGRILYDFGHIRSAIMLTRTGAQPSRSTAARGGWSGHGPNRDLVAPDYTKLPPELRFRTAATDPITPTRLASQAALFYPTSGPNGVVYAPNSILEPLGPGDPPALESALDTLYEFSRPEWAISPAPAMLYYHGRENAPFLFTGFDIWSWSHDDCQALVDFVLSDIWGLRSTGPHAAGIRASAGAAGRTVAPRTRPQASAARPSPRVQPRR